jgi:hypothetical protein
VVRTAEVVVASFPTPDLAHAAVTRLELAGVAANDVHMLTQPVQVGAARRQRADDRMMRWFERRWLVGAVIGAVVGALVIGIPVSIIWHGESIEADIAAALGGAVAGAFIGGFISIGAQMPRTRHAWDTFLLEHDGEVCVGITVEPRRDAHELAEVLRDAGATTVEQLQGS